MLRLDRKEQRKNSDERMTTKYGLSEETALRLGYLVAGNFCLYQGFQIWVRGRVETNPHVVGLTLIVYAISFVLLGIAFSSETNLHRFEHLLLLGVLFVTLSSGYVIAQILYKGAYRTDALAFSHYSAILFLRGYNPYVMDLDPAFAMFPVDPSYITLTPSMDISTNLAYPALHFLYFVPFVAAGIRDMRVILFAFEITTFVLLYFKAPRGLRPLVLAPIIVNTDLVIDFNAGSVTDALWVLPMVAMVFLMKDPIKSGLLYGVACATKQQPWILAPFLLVWILKEGKHGQVVKLCRAIRFFGAASVAFLTPNLAFMAMNFNTWVNDILSPISGGLIVLSQGLSVLTQAGLLDLPPTFYFGATVALLLTLLGNYVVYFRKLKHTIWLFPAVIMWFSYRALQNYFMYWVPVAVAGYLAWKEEKEDDFAKT